MVASVEHLESITGSLLPGEEVSQAEFARRVGCSRQNINKLIVTGKINKNKRGQLDFDLALKDYENNTDATHYERLERPVINAQPENVAVEPLVDIEQAEEKQISVEPVAVVTDDESVDVIPLRNDAEEYKKHRTDREQANARLATLKADQLAGELIPSVKVERDAFSLARGLRDAILSVPERVAPIIAAQSDDREVAKILSEELEKALNGLIDSVQKHKLDD